MAGVLCSMLGATFASGARPAETITAVGNAQVSTAQSKFGGASALLDGTGDYLTTSAIDPTSTQFTIEGWFYITNKTTRNAGDIWQGDIGQSNRRHQVYFVYSGAEANRIYLALGVTSPFTFLYVSHTVTINTWFHLAISRDSSNNIRWFINGTQVGTTQNNSREFFGNASTTGRIGSISYNAGAGDLFGYIDEFRISTTARYTANFTAPTAPFVNDSNTVLLLHMDGTNASTTFTDDNGSRLQNGVSAIGNAQVDTAQSKFGGASFLSDGTTDYLRIKTNSNFEFSSSSTFTVECWLRTTAVNNYATIFGKYTASGSFNGWGFEISPNNSKLEFWDGVAWRAFNASTLTTNTWHHAAVVCNAGSCKMYFNGTEQTTTFTLTSSVVNTTTDLFVGARADGLFSFTGHLDEVRISNNVRYTGNFTPSTTAFTNDENTVLLLHMDGTDASTTFTDDNS